MLDKSMPVFFSRPFLSQTFSLSLNQMHVVFSESVFHVENLLYPPDILDPPFLKDLYPPDILDQARTLQNFW